MLRHNLPESQVSVQASPACSVAADTRQQKLPRPGYWTSSDNPISKITKTLPAPALPTAGASATAPAPALR